MTLVNKPIVERRKHLVDHMTEVDNHVKLSEVSVLDKKSELADMIKNVLKQGLEGDKPLHYATASSLRHRQKFPDLNLDRASSERHKEHLRTWKATVAEGQERLPE